MPGGFGGTPWGSNWGSSAEGQLEENVPSTPVWDGFDLSSPVDVDNIQRFAEVSTIGSENFFIGSFNIASGGSYPTNTAALTISVAVAATFTLQYRLKLNELPEDFSEVAQGSPCGRHIYLGAWSSQGYAVGFFVSKQGWAYTGEVTVDGGSDIVPAQAVATIPGSSVWLDEGKEYDIRIVVDPELQLVYLYISPVGTKLSLKAVLVAMPTISAVADASMMSVKGSLLDPSWLELFEYKLSNKKLLPDIPPVANAGVDQAILRCSILRLDGGQSFDPDGAPLTYEWRLVDAPLSSIYTVAGGDGYTLVESPPTGFTDIFYSAELATADGVEPIQVNDVLTLGSGSFTVKEIVRTPSFYVRVEYEQLPESATGLQYRLLRQNGVAGPTTVSPTFYPDVLGFYVFDLRVHDGTTSSSPLGTDRSRVLINVLDSPLPKGCGVDANFLFEYLLSFWKLVEDKDRIATLWEALARTAATEIYTLWQVEYAKSLRDIQRVFVRRWLHYDGLLPEPSPELTSIRYTWGGVTSDSIAGGTVAGVDGTYLVVSSPFLPDVYTVPLIATGTITPEEYARQLQVRIGELLGPSVSGSVWWTRAEALSAPTSSVSYSSSVEFRTLIVTIDGGTPVTATVGTPQTAEEFIQELATQLPLAAVSFTPEGSLRIGSRTVGGTGVVSSVSINAASTLLVANGGPFTFSVLTGSAVAYVHVAANLPFTVTTLSTAPCFTYPCVNTILGASSGGHRMSDRTFRTSVSLAGAPVREDDLLVLDRTTYRVVRIVDDPTDPFVSQRIVVKDALPSTASAGVEWSIPGWVDSTFLDFWNGLVDRGDHVDFEVVVPVGQQFTTNIVSATALGVNQNLLGRLALNTAELAAQLSLVPGSVAQLARVQRRRYIPVDDRVVDVPILTEQIEVEDQETVLRRNADFFIELFRGHNAIRFSVGVGADLGDVWEGGRPPPRLWAEYTHLDNEELIEANFGAAIGLTRDKVPSSVDYLSAMRGIWYALYNGPTLANLRIALQIFLGLPFAEDAGVIEEIRTDFFTQNGRILIRDTNNVEIVRSYTYPRVLDVEVNPATGAPYRVGDFVTQFAPLVTGVEVVDWVKDPKWFEGLINQGVFYEVQKYHSFLVRVDSRAFDLASLMFARQFISSIKPVYTDPTYMVQFDVSGTGNEVDVTDTTDYAVTLNLFDTPCDRMGASVYFDEPWAAGAAHGESWRNNFDADDNPTTAAPTYPGPPDPVHWGFDKEWLCPEDRIEGERCVEYADGAIPAFDSVFAFDRERTRQEYATPAAPVSYVGTVSLLTVLTIGMARRLSVTLVGPTVGANTTQTEWLAELLLNGDVVADINFSIGYIHPVDGLVVTLPQNIELIYDNVDELVLLGDVLELRVGPVVAVAQEMGWTSFDVSVSFGLGTWGYDVPIDEGDYCSVGSLVGDDPVFAPPPPPEAEITSPASGSVCWGGVPVTVRGTGSNIATIAVYASGSLLPSTPVVTATDWSVTFTPAGLGLTEFTVRIIGPGGVLDLTISFILGTDVENAVWQLLAEYPVEMLILPQLADFTVNGTNGITQRADRSRTGVVITDGALVNEGTPRNRHLSAPYAPQGYTPKDPPQLEANGTDWVAAQVNNYWSSMYAFNPLNLSGGKYTVAVHFKYQCYTGAEYPPCILDIARDNSAAVLSLTAETWAGTTWFYARYPAQSSSSGQARRRMIGASGSYEFVAIRWDASEASENARNRAWRNGAEQTTYNAEWGPSGTYGTDVTLGVMLGGDGGLNPYWMHPPSAISAFVAVSEAIPADELNVGGRFDTLWRSILGGY